MAARKKLPIVASMGCLKSNSQGKPWFHFRSFVWSYWELLSGYTLLVSWETKAILLEIEAELRNLLGIKANFIMEELGNSRVTLNNIANQRAEEIERILLFLDPKDLRNQLEKTPLQMMSERGHKVHLNFGAALWAEQEWRRQTASDHPYSETRAVEELVLAEETVTSPMFKFLAGHCAKFGLFRQVLTTTEIKNVINILLEQRPGGKNERPKIHLPNRSPYGELFALSNHIILGSYNRAGMGMHPAQGARFHVVAFTDYPNHRIPGPDMQKFYEICADPRLRVNLLLNQQTADEWIHQFELLKCKSAGGYADN